MNQLATLIRTSLKKIFQNTIFRNHSFALAGYILVTLAITYPVLPSINTSLYGFFENGDWYTYIWRIWWYKTAILNNLSPDFVTHIQAPFGTEYAINVDFKGLYYLLGSLAILFGEITTFNLYIILSYIASSFLAYLLTFRILGDHRVSFIAGLIFGFAPSAVSRARLHHLDLLSYWIIPLFFLMLMNLQGKADCPFGDHAGIEYCPYSLFSDLLWLLHRDFRINLFFL